MTQDAVDHALKILNEIVELDSSVLTSLIRGHRVPCNTALAVHPTVQVGYVDEEDYSKGYEVGLLGIINGLFGSDEAGWGHIYAHIDDVSGEVIRFSRGTHEEHKTL